MIVEDATKDPRFRTNPLVTGSPFIRFYAGVKLLSPEGYCLGTLCVIHDEPKTLTDKQENALRTLAHSVMYLLNLRRTILRLKVIRRIPYGFSNCHHRACMVLLDG